jgi:hypothetical protein
MSSRGKLDLRGTISKKILQELEAERESRPESLIEIWEKK